MKADRGYFQACLEEMIWEFQFSSKPFSLLSVEIDHFGQYIDKMGDSEGDKLLVEAAALIKSYVRDMDPVCRYGEDKFAVILKNTDQENSARTAERIREAFQYRFHTYPVKITASIGVANFPEDATNQTDLLGATQFCLHISKSSGGNRVIKAAFLKPPRSGERPSDDPRCHPFASFVPPWGPAPAVSHGDAKELPALPETDSEDS